MAKDRIIDQLRRNAVALISLVIAITSLGYNTWRNEHTENNRNQRWASFEVLLKLGELRELINYIHYDCNLTMRGNPRSGWVIVQTIEDLTLVLEEMTADDMPDSASRLKDAWSTNWQGLEYSDEASCRERSVDRGTQGREAVDAIRMAIDDVRTDILSVLHSLD